MAVSGKDPDEAIKGKVSGKKSSSSKAEYQGEQPISFPQFKHVDAYKHMSLDERKKLSDDMMRVHKRESGTSWFKAEEG
jgi:hypothetical protein